MSSASTFEYKDMTPFDIAKAKNSSKAKEMIADNDKHETSMTDLMRAARVGDYDAVENHAQSDRKLYFVI